MAWLMDMEKLSGIRPGRRLVVNAVIGSAVSRAMVMRTVQAVARICDAKAGALRRVYSRENACASS